MYGRGAADEQLILKSASTCDRLILSPSVIPLTIQLRAVLSFCMFVVAVLRTATGGDIPS